MNLYHDSLLKVNSAVLITRYNEALRSLGLPETKLSSFHIDALGWSPEIAAEHGNPHYLSHGEANPLGILLSPDQRNLALYRSATSFDAEMLRRYFEQNLSYIADLTQDACITLDFDQGLSSYHSPQDLLLLRSVTLRSSAGETSLAAAEQAELVNRFVSSPLGWFDADLRTQIIESAAEHGDLRSRKLPQALHFEISGSFHVAAFDGVFVLRTPSGNHYLILENATHLTKSTDAVLLALDDPELLEQLMGEDLIALDLRWYAQNPDVLKALLIYLQVDLLTQNEPDIDISALSAAQFRQRVRGLSSELPQVHTELEQLIARLSAGQVPRYSDLSTALSRLLVHPHPSLKGSERDLIWQLLLRLNPLDPVRLYRTDKEQFFKLYQAWPTGKQRWVDDLLK